MTRHHLDRSCHGAWHMCTHPLQDVAATEKAKATSDESTYDNITIIYK